MRSAIVTGAGAGIGRATSLLLAARGWRVLMCDIDGDAAARAAAEARGEVVAVATDVTNDDALADLIARAMHDPLATVVHCAALFPQIALADTRIADFDRVMAVNLRAAVRLTLLAATAMRDGGALIFLTSGSDYCPPQPTLFSGASHSMAHPRRPSTAGWPGSRPSLRHPGFSRAPSHPALSSKRPDWRAPGSLARRTRRRSLPNASPRRYCAWPRIDRGNSPDGG